MKIMIRKQIIAFWSQNMLLIFSAHQLLLFTRKYVKNFLFSFEYIFIGRQEPQVSQRELALLKLGDVVGEKVKNK